MRKLIAALPLLAPMLALAACGGASGPETVGSIAPPAAGGGGTGTGGGTGGTGGSGGGIGGGGGTQTPTPTPGPANFLDVSTASTFKAIGSFQTLAVSENGAGGGPQLYAGNASTVRAPSGSIAYDPRDGIFTIQFSDEKAGLTSNVRFQDPAHRNTRGGLSQPSWGVPTNLTDFNFLEVVGPSARAATATDMGRDDSITFFYQRPGSQTKYVSLAGFVRNAYDLTADPRVFKELTTSNFERGAMVFGQETQRSQIPLTGTGTYTGGLLATMVAASDTSAGSHYQWITGDSSLTLDFSRQTMSMLLTGTVSSAVYGGQLVGQAGTPAGSTFEAKGSGTISLTGSGGFTGSFGGVDAAGVANYVRFVTNGVATPVNITNVSQGQAVAGASSIDGTFFGPDAVNVGGNFRIVGGVPNQRVDILGAFTGARK